MEPALTEQERIPVGIEGAWLQPLLVIPANGGAVMHMLRQDYALMPRFPDGFGEIYFSEVMPGCVKAWKLHERQRQLFAAPMGKLLIALCDNRVESPTFGKLATLHLGRPDNYSLLAIPPGVWYGFKALGQTPALICNCADIPHDPAEARRLPPNSERIPFSWA